MRWRLPKNIFFFLIYKYMKLIDLLYAFLLAAWLLLALNILDMQIRFNSTFQKFSSIFFYYSRSLIWYFDNRNYSYWLLELILQVFLLLLLVVIKRARNEKVWTIIEITKEIIIFTVLEGGRNACVQWCPFALVKEC